MLVVIQKRKLKGIKLELEEDKLTPEQEIEARIIDIFHQFDILGNYTNHKWFYDLNLYKLQDLYQKSEDMFNYRINLPSEEKKKYVKDGLIFRTKLNFINKCEIKILILDNTINNNSQKILKEIKKTKLNIYHLNEKKRGIVYARNKCLLSAKEFDPDYLVFIDDDVRLDKNWLQNNLLIMNKFKADIVTGPQKYLKINQNKNLINYNELFEKK